MYLLKIHLQSFQQSIYFHHSAINVIWSEMTNYVNESANIYAGKDCLILPKRKYFIPFWWVSKSKSSTSQRGAEQWVEIAQLLLLVCCMLQRLIFNIWLFFLSLCVALSTEHGVLHILVKHSIFSCRPRPGIY